MVRGYYTAASGIVTQEKKLNTYANNIANVATAGYKKDALIVSTFGEHLATRMDTYRRTQLHEKGRGVFMTTVDTEYVDFEQGPMQTTMRPLDMAIQGPGFFVVNAADGNQYLSRSGEFALDAEGYLILEGYGRIQGESGDIQLGTSSILVDRNGNIYLEAQGPDEEPEQIDRLAIAVPNDYTNFYKLENGMFLGDDFTLMEENTGTVILQNTIEKSNVNMAEEMSRIIASQRALQSSSQIVRMYDEINQKANDQIGRVR